MFSLFYLLIFFLADVLPWLAPLAVSSLTGAGAGYGSFRFGQGALTQRVEAIEKQIERDAIHSTEERAGLVTRHEFELLRDDIKDIKTDVRELRRYLTKR